MADSIQTCLAANQTRPRLGNFLVNIGTESKPKLKLTECPICALDSDRERQPFYDEETMRYKKPTFHFLNEHGPDDIGRPMAELLPERGGRP